MSKTIKKTKIRVLLGSNIRKLRRELSLSQEELGFRANLHRTYIGAIERGEQNVSIDNIEAIAIQLKVEVFTLLKK